MISTLEIKFNAKIEKINALETAVTFMQQENASNAARITALEDKLINCVQNNINLKDSLYHVREDLFVAIDDLAQYGRKPSLRIEGIPFVKGETNDQLKTKVIDSLNEIHANVSDADIFRLHRSGKPHKDRDTGILVAQSIVRFRHWAPRDRAYKAKKFAKDNSLPQQVKLDLTKRRLTLLNRARDALGKKHPIAHAYADAECNLLIKNRAVDQKFFFNTEKELFEILSVIETETPERNHVPDEVVERDVTTGVRR